MIVHVSYKVHSTHDDGHFHGFRVYAQSHFADTPLHDLNRHSFEQSVHFLWVELEISKSVLEEVVGVDLLCEIRTTSVCIILPRAAL